MYGPTNPYEDTNNAPATAASIEPTANVIDIVLFTLIPISSAAPLSSETANIALPVFVKFIKRARPIIISVVAPKVTTDSPVNSIGPKLKPFTVITDATLLCSEPKIKSAVLCKK